MSETDIEQPIVTEEVQDGGQTKGDPKASPLWRFYDLRRYTEDGGVDIEATLSAQADHQQRQDGKQRRHGTPLGVRPRVVAEPMNRQQRRAQERATNPEYKQVEYNHETRRKFKANHAKAQNVLRGTSRVKTEPNTHRAIHPRLLTMPEDEVLLRRKAKRVKNPQDVEVEIAAMKQIAAQWEKDNGRLCEGLAATQANIPLRIVLIRKNRENVDPWFVLINPTFVRSDDTYDSKGEGCLSIPGKHGDTIRPNNVVFRYTNPDGRRSGLQIAKDFAASVVVHELDHLSGVLWTDNALAIRHDKDVDDTQSQKTDMVSEGGA